MPFLIPKGFIFNLYFLIPKLYFPHDNHVYYFLLYHWWFFFNVILKECFLYCLIFIFLNSLPYLNVQLAYRCLSPECLLACCRLLRFIMSKSDRVLFHHIFFSFLFCKWLPFPRQESERDLFLSISHSLLLFHNNCQWVPLRICGYVVPLHCTPKPKCWHISPLV